MKLLLGFVLSINALQTFPMLSLLKERGKIYNLCKLQSNPMLRKTLARTPEKKDKFQQKYEYKIIKIPKSRYEEWHHDFIDESAQNGWRFVHMHVYTYDDDKSSQDCELIFEREI